MRETLLSEETVQSQPSDVILPALRTVVYSIIGVLLFAWVIRRVRTLDESLGARLPGWLLAPGILLAVLGAALVFSCLVVFVTQGRGTPFIADPPQRFVQRGPYYHVRNPLYVAQVLILAGIGLWFGSVSVVVLAAVWFLAVHLFVVYVEEPGLHKRFGAEYERYCRIVPRWLPRLNRADDRRAG